MRPQFAIILTVSLSTVAVSADDGLPIRGICAHRGASETHPENTLAAFREAIRLGAHMIEFDVALSKDKQLVILHDRTVDRTTDGTGPVSEFTLAELRELDAGSWKDESFAREKIPTLDETLAMMPLNVWLNVHLKGGPELAAFCAQRIVAHDRLQQAFLACGADAARAAQRVDERVQICNMEDQANNERYVNETIDRQAEFIQLLRGDSVSPQLTQKLIEHGVRINYCCANEADVVKGLLESGVQFPLVDDLAPMMEVADAFGIERLQPIYRQHESIQFSEHLIANGYSYPFGLAVADFDGDGDLDLSSPDYQPSNCLYLFENDGQGSFQHRYIQKNDARRIERHAVGDINRDGWLDIVIVKNLYGHLLWFENPGPQRAMKQLWPRHVLTTRLPGAYTVALADFDDDGDLDVAASSWVLGNQYAWFENDGTPADTEWKKHFIETGVAETRCLRVADFDGDGDPDLFATAPKAGVVMWYENVGGSQEERWKKHPIDRVSRAMHGDPVDMDGDGDVDVVMAAGMPSYMDNGLSHHLYWYENSGQPAQEGWTRHVISSTWRDAFEALGADLDSDGDIDVVATSWRDPGRLAWFENIGDSQVWKEHLLKQNWRSANKPIVADLNGDGRLDIAAVAEHTSYELRWWRNEGAARPVPDLAQAARRVTQTIAHQGAKAYRPANTLAAIRLGIESGVTAVEVDVRSTKDGHLVVRHDAALDKTTDGTGLVKDHTLAELRQLDAGSWFDPKYAGERIPTLREALELCKSHVDLLLDLKEQTTEFNQALAREVRVHGDSRRTIFGVRTGEQARELRQLDGEARQLGLIPGPDAIEEFVAAGVQTIRLRRASYRDSNVLARLRSFTVGLHINVGLGAEDEVRTRLAFTPDSLSADDPELLVSNLQKLRGEETAPVISVAQPVPTADEARRARHAAAHRKRRIIMNNDGNDCRKTDPGAPHTQEAMLARRTTPLIGSHVDAIFYCTGVFNLYRHHSRRTELMVRATKGDDDWGWELGRDGPDVLATMVNFGQRNGIEVFWSMRMNDTHDAKYPGCMSQWKLQHPQCLVGRKGEQSEYGRCRWSGRWSSLDYEHPMVRDKAFEILRDVAVRYDVDGLELDFFRHPIYFKPQMAGEPVTQRHCDIMTEFVRRVWEMTEDQARWRGRPLLIAIRVPDSLGYCKAIGLDVERWLEEGIVDIVTGGGYFHLEPWENLAALGKRFDVPVYAGLSASRLGHPSLLGDRFNRRNVVGPEIWRGEAMQGWEAGVSGIYIFNCFNPHDPIFRELGDPQMLKKLERRYVPNPGAIDHWVKGGEQFVQLGREGD